MNYLEKENNQCNENIQRIRKLDENVVNKIAAGLFIIIIILLFIIITIIRSYPNIFIIIILLIIYLF